MANLATINNNLLADSGVDPLLVVVTNGSYANPAWITSLGWSKITGTPTTLAGYGITNALKWNTTGGYVNGLNNTAVVPNSVTLFDYYDAPVPNYPAATSQFWVAALTMGDASRGFQIAGGYSDNEMYYRKGVGELSGWQGWIRVLNNLNFNEYAPTLSGTGATGTWPISITGAAGSVAFNNLTSKTGGTGTYQTSGDFRAPIFYDSADTGYYVDPNAMSSLRAITTGGGFANFGVYRTDPAANFGPGRTYLRIHPTASGARIISFKITINSSWNWIDAFGFISADVSFYFNGTDLYAQNTTVTSATGQALINLSIGAPVIVDGYIAIPIYCNNTNPIAALIESGLGATYTDFSFTAWESVAFPGQVTVTVPGAISTGASTITSTLDEKLKLVVSSSDTNDWNYISFTGRNGVRDAYFGTDSDGTPTWFRDDNNLNITLGSVAAVNGVQIVTNSGTWGIGITGNAGTVTNGVYTTGSYANPSWLTSLAWSKITGTPTTIGGYGITDAAKWQYVGQSNIDSIKAPGLYEYDPIPTGTPPVQSPNIRTIEIGKDSRYTQVAFPYDSDNMYFRRQYNADWLPWLTVIHSGNYTTYTVTKTGGGASGDWGINITGNAATATNATTASNATQFNGLNFNGLNTRFSGNINTLGLASTSGIYNIGSGYTNGPAGDLYGTLFGIWNYDISVQFWASYNGDFYWRKSVGTTYTGSTWRTILDTVNYSSYALPIGGGTLTGLLTIQTLSDFKLRLTVPTGDSSEWNYIEFVGSNGVRDAYFGTDGGGTPTWYNDSTAVNITLGSVAAVNGTQIVTNSGTWGISISGNAATATNSTQLGGIGSSGFYRQYTVPGGVITPATGLDAGNQGWAAFDGYGTPVPNYPNSQYWVGLWQGGDSGRGIQFAGGYSDYEMYFRKGAGGWLPWVRVLNDYNYNSYSPTLTGTGASGTWGINITGSAGSVAFNNLTSKTGGTGTYQTSGDFRAPIFYDSADTGYYVDPNGFSNIKALSTGGGFTQYGTAASQPPENYGPGRIYLRIHPTSSGARIISFKMTVSSTWNWAAAFGSISADVSFYFDGSSLYAPSVTVTSATGLALSSLSIGQLAIENGYISVPIFSANTNPIFVNLVGSPSFNWNDISWGGWQSVSFPGAVTVNVPGAFSVSGNIGVGGSSSFNGPVTISTTGDGLLTLRTPSDDTNEWNYIQFVLRNNTRRSYLGLDGSGVPQWYRDDNGLNVSLTSVFSVSGGVSSGGNIIAGNTGNNSQRRIHANVTLSQNNGIYIGSINDTSATGRYSIDFPGWRDNNTNPICARIAAVAKWNCCNGYPSTGYAGVRGLDLVFYTNTGWNDVEPEERMRIYDSGNINVNNQLTAAAFFESSDSRLKEVIQDEYKVEGVHLIKPKLYKKNGKIELGYFAQDFEEIMPYAIMQNDNEEYLNLSYREVHTAKITYLEDSIEEIKAKILYLENQLKTKQ